MATTPPQICIEGGAAGEQAEIGVGGPFTATLDSIDGVNNVSWDVVSTDDLAVAGQYTCVTSGTYNETVTVSATIDWPGSTAFFAGTAGLLQATVNAGVDPQTGNNSVIMTARSKFYVLTADGLEVGCADEKLETDRVYGNVVLLNALIRAGGGSGSLTVVYYSDGDPPLTLATGNLYRVDTSGAPVANLTMPSSPTSGRSLIVKDGRGFAASNNIPVVANAGFVIEDPNAPGTFSAIGGTVYITTNGAAAEWVADTDSWLLV